MQEGLRGIMGREWIKTEPDSSGVWVVIGLYQP